MTSDLGVRSVAAGTTDRWESFVAGHPRSSVFHTPAWLRAVASAFEYRAAHRLVYDASDPVAVVPGFRVSEVVGSSVVNPFCEYGCPLVADRADARAVLDAVSDTLPVFGAWIVKEATGDHCRHYPRAGFGAVETGVSVRTAVDRDYAAFRESTLDAEARRCIERAAAAGVTATTGTVDEYYPLYLDTMRRLGSPPFPKSFLRALSAAFGGRATVHLARLDGRAVAGVLVLEHDGTAVVWSNASDDEYWEYNPNHYLYARVIRRCCAGDHKVVDLGRSQPGGGVHWFKSQFGDGTASLASYVTPPHRTGRGDVDRYRHLQAVTKRLSPVVAHPTVGPRLKERVHE